MKAWKELEKEVARRLDGQRVVRENFGHSDCDVRHPIFSIECKFRSGIGVWYNNYLDDMRVISGNCTIDRKISDLIHDSFKQCERYDAKKKPLVVVKLKQKQFDDAIVFMKLKDFPLTLIKTHVVSMSSVPLVFTGLREFTIYWEQRKDRLLKPPVEY